MSVLSDLQVTRPGHDIIGWLISISNYLLFPLNKLYFTLVSPHVISVSTAMTKHPIELENGQQFGWALVSWRIDIRLS